MFNINRNFLLKSNKQTLKIILAELKIGVIDTKSFNHLKPADTQYHVLHECVAFEDLRDQFDTREDSQLVEFFKQVVKRRIENGED